MISLLSPVAKETQCSICDDSNLEELLVFPSFPFTGIYCDSEHPPPEIFATGIDQGFSFCSTCGHGQLTHVVDPKLVYDDTYSHRGSTSPLATGGNRFFKEFIDRLFPNKCFPSIVDVGCNDGFLLQLLEDKAEQLTGFDPIWEKQRVKLSQKTTLVGGFIEEVDLGNFISSEPGLIVSTHTFEHIERPMDVLQKLVSQVPNGTTFVIEVPSLDTLVRLQRYDQIFHQHLQYFSQYSFAELIRKLGCSYLAHDFNYGFWGGTMLFAFVKGKALSRQMAPTILPMRKESIIEGFKGFKRSLANLSQYFHSFKRDEIVGFGAAQMLPSLAYHAPCRFESVKTILDDNVQRQNKQYPGFNFTVRPTDSVDVSKRNVLITALDSARPILSRLSSLKTRSILLPLQVI